MKSWILIILIPLIISCKVDCDKINNEYTIYEADDESFVIAENPEKFKSNDKILINKVNDYQVELETALNEIETYKRDLMYALLEQNEYKKLYYEKREICDTFELCRFCSGSSLDVKRALNGLYYKDEMFCVWTRGRTEQEINLTIHHEYLHTLIEDKGKKEHFCG